MLNFAYKGLVNLLSILWFFLNMVTLVTMFILVIAFAIDPYWLTQTLEVTCQK